VRPPGSFPRGSCRSPHAELNLSETTFASQASAEQKAQSLSFVNRIFTIDEELPFAGHPTLGTASSLLSRGLISSEGPIVQSCLAGPIRITASADASQISLSAPHKYLSSPLPLGPGILAGALSLDPARTDGLEVYVSSCGLPWAYVRLRSEQDLLDLKPSMSGVATLLASLPELDAGAPVCGISVFFAEQMAEAETRVHARVLLPFQPEDSATGSAGVA
jgi:trans-2,3-dihydro-3-hydroxyanthranilate isomerase